MSIAVIGLFSIPVIHQIHRAPAASVPKLLFICSGPLCRRVVAIKRSTVMSQKTKHYENRGYIRRRPWTSKCRGFRPSCTGRRGQAEIPSVHLVQSLGSRIWGRSTHLLVVGFRRDGNGRADESKSSDPRELHFGGL